MIAWALVVLCVVVHVLSARLPEGTDEDFQLIVDQQIVESYDALKAQESGSGGSEAGSAGSVEEPTFVSERRGATGKLGTLEWFTESPSQVRFQFTFGAIPALMHWWQPFTYQFLHGGWFHLIMNMIFLVAFGSVLEARLGKLGFLALFLVGGAFAAYAQAWIGRVLEPDSSFTIIVGASGSISALMGAAYAMHPRANVTGIAIPQFVRAQTSLRWMMGFAIALDIARTIVGWSEGGSGIATLAHLGGVVFGFGVGAALLASGILRRDDVDALYLFKQWRRRREMRQAMLEAGVGQSGQVAARVRADGDHEETDAQRTLRSTIAAAHRERDYVLAARLYLELLQTLPDATLPAAIQLDVANQLAGDGKNAHAAAAYARFLERFRTHVAADDVRVMLAVVLARRLGDKAAARTALDGFGTRELDRDRQALIDELRRECA